MAKSIHSAVRWRRLYGDPGDFEGCPWGSFRRRMARQDTGGHADEHGRGGARGTAGGDVDHADFAASGVVRGVLEF